MIFNIYLSFIQNYNMENLLNNDAFFCEQILKRLDQSTINKLMTSSSRMANMVITNLDKIISNLRSVRTVIDDGEALKNLRYNPQIHNCKSVMLNDGNVYSEVIIRQKDTVSSSFFKNGKKHGPSTSTLNGEVIYSATYFNGKMEGLTFEYKDKLAPRFYNTIIETFYVNGVKNGIQRIIEVGDYEDVYEYVNGLKHGDYKRYGRNKKILRCGFYVNGLQDGIFAQWSREGKMVSTRTYDKGIMITRTILPQ
jgi:antitoxin component YwqK of YwqJK toxin-antitoxin module